MGEHELNRAVANLPAEFLQHQRLKIGLVIDDEDGCGHAACPSLVSISWRGRTKSVGFVKRPIASFSIAILSHSCFCFQAGQLEQEKNESPEGTDPVPGGALSLGGRWRKNHQKTPD